jgi:hypothetical protein
MYVCIVRLSLCLPVDENVPRIEARRGFSSSNTVSADVLNTPYSSATQRIRILPTLKLFTSNSSPTVFVDRDVSSDVARPDDDLP